jgi:hypothetical protein
MVAHAFNPRTREAEAGGFLSSRPVWSQSEFQDSQGYTEKPCLKTKTKTNKQKFKKRFGEMAQHLRALTALPEVLTSILRNHMVAHNHL